MYMYVFNDKKLSISKILRKNTVQSTCNKICYTEQIIYPHQPSGVHIKSGYIKDRLQRKDYTPPPPPPTNISL